MREREKTERLGKKEGKKWREIEERDRNRERENLREIKKERESFKKEWEKREKDMWVKGSDLKQ